VTPEQIAVVSDIHGNRWALEAVLADIERRGVAVVFNLGDCLYGPLEPAATAELLTARDWATVRGNEDRIIVDSNLEAAPGSTLAFVREQLAPDHRDFLHLLPLTREEGEFLLCHGTPVSDEEYLLHQATEAGLGPRPHDGIAERLAGSEIAVVLCGHDHLPGRVHLANGGLVVNPGSVGLQAYTDDVPHPHAVENGSPHARYCVMEKDATGWRVDTVQLTYDWHSAAETARRNGRPDWARWLATGRVG
jgi:predicted phosphodiesterase